MRGSRLAMCLVALWAITSTGACSSSSSNGGSGQNKTPNGLGATCTKDTDCKSELTCHIDTSSYTAHDLCTTPCQSNAECTQAFGDNTMCIGAQVCVVKCAENADCTSGTVCNDYGWCERGGPGSGIPKCSGTVGSCSTITSDTGCALAGCTWNSTCTGVPQLCSQQYSSTTCSFVDGCYWSSLDEECSGVATPCASLQSYANCVLQTGCTSSGSCGGLSVFSSCESAGRDFCTSVPGCQLVTQ